MKTPNQCENMADIRAEIDRLDRQVVALLGQRFAYVKAAPKFKTSEATVKAPERFRTMLGQRSLGLHLSAHRSVTPKFTLDHRF
jgi:isochorismate pyruvate lyase